MIDHARRLREIDEWLADPTDFVVVKRTAFEAAEEIDRLRDVIDAATDRHLRNCATICELEARVAELEAVASCARCGGRHLICADCNDWRAIEPA